MAAAEDGVFVEKANNINEQNMRKQDLEIDQLFRMLQRYRELIRSKEDQLQQAYDRIEEYELTVKAKDAQIRQFQETINSLQTTIMRYKTDELS